MPEDSIQTGCYVHIPFCRQRCTYCDFNTYVGLLSLQDAYISALQEEISLRADRNPGIKINTLYFGGGTPSLLSAEAIEMVIRQVRQYWSLQQTAEVTLEANPGTVDGETLEALVEVGVNRLSLGIQSSHSHELVLLGRLHTWPEAVQAFEMARKAGFASINIDLMYSLPGQNLQSWIGTLERVLALQPDHLSLYALTLEPGTPLALTLVEEDIEPPDPDLAADMYDASSSMLQSAGFWQYEISNWAKAATPPSEIWELPAQGVVESIGPHISQHNVIYWRNNAWLGIGAGAHSWFHGRRFSHHPHPQSYINAIRSGKLQGLYNENIPSPLAQDETMMLGLRLVEGVTDSRFRKRWHTDLYDTYGETIDRLVQFGLITYENDRVRLTAQARLVSNQVFQEFLR